MPLHSEHLSNEDIRRWVRILQDPAESPEAKNGAMQALSPLIVRKATVAAARLPRWLREDAVAEAAGWIWEKIGRFDTSRETSFAAWVQTVLTRQCADKLRGRDKKGTGPFIIAWSVWGW